MHGYFCVDVNCGFVVVLAVRLLLDEGVVKWEIFVGVSMKFRLVQVARHPEANSVHCFSRVLLLALGLVACTPSPSTCKESPEAKLGAWNLVLVGSWTAFGRVHA